MGYFLSLTYWIPFIYLTSFGYIMHGILHVELEDIEKKANRKFNIKECIGIS